MNIQIAWCEETIEGVSQAISEVELSFDCEWDDGVHESFQNYISEIKVVQTAIVAELGNIKSVNSELDDLDIDVLIAQSNNLGVEIEGI